jgi:hypothetical protein
MSDLQRNVVEALRAEYFPNDGLSTYMLLDGAATRALIEHLYDDAVEFTCLISGPLEPDMQEVAPYLAVLRDGEPFTDWILSHALGENWGSVLRSSLSMDDLARRYRRLLRVRGPDGEPLFFRYYDPRVLRVFLPTCEADDLDEWFDGVRYYFAESGDPGVLLRFRTDGTVVEKDELRLPAAT